ncbi:hypothetical protein V8C86DRAFT_3114331 [Haematococcus lacustris]
MHRPRDHSASRCLRLALITILASFATAAEPACTNFYSLANSVISSCCADTQQCLHPDPAAPSASPATAACTNNGLGNITLLCGGPSSPPACTDLTCTAVNYACAPGPSANCLGRVACSGNSTAGCGAAGGGQEATDLTAGGAAGVQPGALCVTFVNVSAATAAGRALFTICPNAFVSSPAPRPPPPAPPPPPASSPPWGLALTQLPSLAPLFPPVAPSPAPLVGPAPGTLPGKPGRYRPKDGS